MGRDFLIVGDSNIQRFYTRMGLTAQALDFVRARNLEEASQSYSSAKATYKFIVLAFLTNRVVFIQSHSFYVSSTRYVKPAIFNRMMISLQNDDFHLLPSFLLPGCPNCPLASQLVSSSIARDYRSAVKMPSYPRARFALPEVVLLNSKRSGVWRHSFQCHLRPYLRPILTRRTQVRISRIISFFRGHPEAS